MTFIEDARRRQIVDAAIETLAELGYGKASFAQIAKRAEISPSLIPYHFTDKKALIEQTLVEMANAWTSYVEQQVATVESPTDQLRMYIQANLAYICARPSHFAALVEILFNARSAEGVLLYHTEEEDAAVTFLKSILARGQRSGEFRKFDVHQMAIAVRGAIDGFLAEMHKCSANLEAFTTEVVELCIRGVATENTKRIGRGKSRRT